MSTKNIELIKWARGYGFWKWCKSVIGCMGLGQGPLEFGFKPMGCESQVGDDKLWISLGLIHLAHLETTKMNLAHGEKVQSMCHVGIGTKIEIEIKINVENARLMNASRPTSTIHHHGPPRQKLLQAAVATGNWNRIHHYNRLYLLNPKLQPISQDFTHRLLIDPNTSRTLNWIP